MIQVGDTVRIPALNATGRVVRVSPRLKQAYLVAIVGAGERAFALGELEKLPDRAWVPMMPPPGVVP